MTLNLLREDLANIFEYKRMMNYFIRLGYAISIKHSLKEPGMAISPKSVRFDEDMLWMRLSDGRTIAASVYYSKHA